MFIVVVHKPALTLISTQTLGYELNGKGFEYRQLKIFLSSPKLPDLTRG
jgi:hypothetical protein